MKQITNKEYEEWQKKRIIKNQLLIKKVEFF